MWSTATSRKRYVEIRDRAYELVNQGKAADAVALTNSAAANNDQKALLQEALKLAQKK